MEGQLRRVRLRLATVVVIIFVFVSSGAFGLEDMVGSSGPGVALALLLVLPVLWALPMGLVCAELGSAIPEEGGYYVWVKRGLGEYWGFQCGWWSWLTTFVDSAVYIALIRDYLASWLDLSPNLAWLLGVAIIAVFAYLNIRGLNVIAISSVVMTVIIMTPFVVMTVLGFAHWHGVPWQPFAYPGQSVLTSIGYALAVGMWMYSGYDSMSVLAGEVEEPRRVIPRGLMIAMPIVVISYFVPTLAALGGVGRWAEWSTEGFTFVEIARQLGGSALGLAMLVAAVVGNLALYQEYLAQGARPAYAMAADHLLPAVLTRTHPKFGTPWVSIVFLAAVNALLVRWGFQTLIVIDVFLMMFYYVLIFVAAIALRVREPGLERPFRVRGGTLALGAICAPAMAIAIIALFTNGGDWLIGGLAGVLTGPIAYLVFKPACRPRPPRDVVPPAAGAATAD
ncbi:MAG TPA: APC family permease [Thermoleophilia bacterium]